MTFPDVTPESQPTDPSELSHRAAAIDRSAAVSDEDRLEDLVVQLHEAPDVQQTVDRFLSFAVEFLTPDHATIALKRRTRLWSAAATDDASSAALAAQLSLGQGPCVTAMSTGLSVLVPDTGQEIRWPEWTQVITPRGRSIFSIPLTAAGTTIGALNLTSERPHIFDAADIRAPRVATYGAVAIAAAQERESLLEAVEASKCIGQAIGVLRERFSIDGDRAFDILRRYSQDRNKKLRQVAKHLLDTGQLPD
ncbi:GAF domain-containing protein [Kribbella steppae]|uniref:GAF domain-containing protein n=1 Tax=Kribbella steppae TaxID=2512223 RepID=A0A4R2H436_9ACTN|nr:GAF and ANTAR domain-containing protein [Kribbella steppae]TCO20383.1 GAF domain-containing protein [Kribbella steppae]